VRGAERVREPELRYDDHTHLRDTAGLHLKPG
jgi:hypothetical protein